jgi:hypothetical protein
MNSQFDVTPYPITPPDVPARDAGLSPEVTLLLRQLVEMQREQIALLRAIVAAHDAGSRWRAFLTRWKEEFPNLSSASCRETMVTLERSYATLLTELVDHLQDNGSGSLDNDFALQEFLDRYGMRLAQLGTILNLVGPLAESGPQGESSGS